MTIWTEYFLHVSCGCFLYWQIWQVTFRVNLFYIKNIRINLPQYMYMDENVVCVFTVSIYSFLKSNLIGAAVTESVFLKVYCVEHFILTSFTSLLCDAHIVKSFTSVLNVKCPKCSSDGGAAPPAAKYSVL